MVTTGPSHFFMDEIELVAWKDLVQFATEVVQQLEQTADLSEKSTLVKDYLKLSEYKENIADIRTCEAFKPEKTEVHLLPDEEHKKLLLDPLGEIAPTPTISEGDMPPDLLERMPTQEDCQEILRYLNNNDFLEGETVLKKYQEYELAPTIQCITANYVN